MWPASGGKSLSWESRGLKVCFVRIYLLEPPKRAASNIYFCLSFTSSLSETIELQLLELGKLQNKVVWSKVIACDQGLEGKGEHGSFTLDLSLQARLVKNPQLLEHKFVLQGIDVTSPNSCKDETGWLTIKVD